MSRPLRPVLTVWVVVSCLFTLPYVLAVLAPPSGRAFPGFFFFVDDQLFYLSFVRQAADRALPLAAPTMSFASCRP